MMVDQSPTNTVSNQLVLGLCLFYQVSCVA